MEEPKRLPFTTVGPPGKEDKAKQPPKTHRFELDLAESTETTCPEFFYTDLLKTVVGNKDKPATGDVPFGDEDDAEKLAAIARAFEEKYNKPEVKKKRKKKWQKNIDHYMQELGDGYDETDTFIDNSEAYDEVLPGQITTKLGGFYINSGKLDFKEVSDDSEDEFQPAKVIKKKRRISSDEESGEEINIVKKKKMKDSLSVDGEVKKKKKKKLFPPGTEKPFKKPKQPQDKEKPKQTKPSTVAALIKSSSPNLNGEVENGITSPVENEPSDEEVPHIISSISMTINEVVAMARAEDSSSQDGEEKKVGDTDGIPKLPAALPDGMGAKIEQLKKHARECQEGKSKFFSAAVNKLLLEVEVLSKQMSVGNRSSMYSHLAAFLPVNKHTLLKRAKTLSLKDQEDRMKEPLDKLRQAVNKMMPALFQAFEAECQKFRQEEGNTEEGGKEEGKEDHMSDSDDESKTNQPETTKKRQFGPRKKFVWDSNVRTLLCDAVRVKMQLFQVSKGRSHSAEEYCKAFLDSEVKPIWPKGWMQTRMLYKESRLAHCQWTNPPKTKKAVAVSKTPSTNPVTQSAKLPAVSSAPAGINGTKVPVVSVQKLTPANAHADRPSPALAKSVSQASTPSVTMKKITPTILDYVTREMTTGSASSPGSILSAKSAPANTPTVPSSVKTNETKVVNSDQKQTEKSWNHNVSDILRSSLTESPPKAGCTSEQRSVSNSMPQNSSSFMAQFSNFLNQGQGDFKKSITDAASPTTVSKMSASQQQMLIEQQAQQIEMHNQQLKLLQEKKDALDKQQLSNIQRANINLQQTPASNNPSNQPKLSPTNIPHSTPPTYPVIKSNITAGLHVKATSMKQAAKQFNPSAKTSVSLLTENVIRKQLNEKGATSLQHPVVHKSGPPLKQGQGQISQVQSSEHYRNVSPSADILRKTSPQSQTVASMIQNRAKPAAAGIPHSAKTGHHTSQVKATVTQVKATQGHSQGHIMYSVSPSNSSSTPSNKMATSLLKSFVGQAQSGSQKYPSIPELESLQKLQKQSRTGSSTLVSPTHWSHTAKTPSQSQVRSTYQGAGDVSQSHKSYAMPASLQMPGFPQSVKLPGFSKEQMAAAYQAAQHLSPESSFHNKQMLARKSPGPPQPPPPPLGNPDLHHYSNLQYGYHGYQDAPQ